MTLLSYSGSSSILLRTASHGEWNHTYEVCNKQVSYLRQVNVRLKCM